MTRSHKANDRDHKGIAEGTAVPVVHLPRFFAKNGHADVDPKKIKKDGGGKGNWGREGDEVQDYAYNPTNPRRRSNSSTHVPRDVKTKFETLDHEPVFEEELHGPSSDSAAAGGVDGESVDEGEKESAASTSGNSVD